MSKMNRGIGSVPTNKLSRMLLAAATGLVVALPTTTMAQERQSADERAAELERVYVVGPKAARQLQCRINWQTTVDPRGGQSLGIEIDDQNVYAVAMGNRLTRLDRGDGKSIWTNTVADAFDKIWGITASRVTTDNGSGFTPDPEKLYITTDPVVMEIDYATGGVVGRQELERVPSTRVLRFNQYLVFGTYSGQIVWHQYEVGQAWRANQLKGPIKGAPILVDGENVSAASLGGTIVTLGGKTARRIWADKFFDGTSTPLSYGNGVVVAASHDQYLWAFDSGNGDVLWRYFTESPLRTPPTVIDDMVMQWVPTEGMVCLDLKPTDEVEARVRWTIKGLEGECLGKFGENIAFFDHQTRTLHLVNASQGAVAKSVALPQVQSIQVVDGQMYVVGSGGRVERLDPIG